MMLKKLNKAQRNCLLKRRKYLLNLLGVTRLHDGKKLYTINSEDEEVTITASNEEDEGCYYPF